MSDRIKKLIARNKQGLTKTHGLSSHPLYYIWRDIKARTTNTNHASYHHYGDRGIQLHFSWQTNPESFIKYILNALGPKPSSKHSLDRIDNDKGYTPGNLRWATQSEQLLNRRSAHGHSLKGSYSATYIAWMNIKKRPFEPTFDEFTAFLAIMGEKPKNSLLDRHDRTKPHGPDNTYWKLKRG
jgi:hypothetical protein